MDAVLCQKMCFFHGNPNQHGSLFYFYIIMLCLSYIHVHTNTRVLAHVFVAKLFVQIRRNKQMLTLLWNYKKGPRLRLLSRLFIFCNVKKWNHARSPNKQTNKRRRHTERISYTLRYMKGQKKAAKQNFRPQQKSRLCFFCHHDMRFFPFVLPLFHSGQKYV